jgi:hypothetical protein
MHRLDLAAIGILFLLACGGAGGPSVDEAASVVEVPSHGSVAFTKWRGGTTTYKFKTDKTVQMTWKNMSGSAVQGTYTHSGDEVHIVLEPADNTGKREAKLRQLSECAMAQYWWLDSDGKVHDDDSTMYERKEPKCD